MTKFPFLVLAFVLFLLCHPKVKAARVLGEVSSSFYFQQESKAGIYKNTMAVLGRGTDPALRIFKMDHITMDWQLMQIFQRWHCSLFTSPIVYLKIVGDIIVASCTGETLEIYEKSYTSWNLVKVIELGFVTVSDNAIALSSETLMVINSDQSNAMIFERNSPTDSFWGLVNIVNSTTPGATWRSVSFDKDIAAIGSENHGIFVLQRSEGAWNFLKILWPLFKYSGESVTISDGVIAVGETETSCSGNVQVFDLNIRGSNSWASPVLICAPSPQTYPCGKFGASLQLSQNLLLIGMPGWESDSDYSEGGAMLFEHDIFTQGWTLVETLRASSDTYREEVGKSLSLFGTLAALGSKSSTVFPFVASRLDYSLSQQTLAPTGSPAVPTQSTQDNSTHSPSPSPTTLIVTIPITARTQWRLAAVGFSCTFSICVLVFNLWNSSSHYLPKKFIQK